MIYSSLAVLALSASAVINPLTNLIHLHPKGVQPDTRVSIVLYNKSTSWSDIKIDGHVYTVEAHRTLNVKAPAGTVIYADSFSRDHRRGDTILQITPQLNKQKVVID